MGKPLLTDEIIEKANRGELMDDQPLDNQETKVIEVGDRPSKSLRERLASHGKANKDKMVYKSRRIENEKRSAFQKKLNLILFVLIILVALLLYAVFKL